MPKIQRSSYSAAEKLKVLQYAELYGIRVAARHFNIDHSMISRWGKIKEKLKLAKGEIDLFGQEICENEWKIVDIDSDSADELEEKD